MIDFGCSTYIIERKFKQLIGTKVYAPTEWFTKHEFAGEPLTCWQIGVLLHNMVFGDIPFVNTNEIIESSRDLEKRQNLSKNCKDFMSKCFIKDPKYRITWKEIHSHIWIKET